MLRRLLLSLMWLSLALAGYAFQQNATLQSGETMTVFYGANSFLQAYNAAKDGDTIVLSEGRFEDYNATQNSSKVFEIRKSISITGAYGFDSSNPDVASIMVYPIHIYVDGVHMEGLNVHSLLGVTLHAVDGTEFSRCGIESLHAEETQTERLHTNTILTDCHIKTVWAMELSKGIVFRNCSIYQFQDKNAAENMALLENCIVTLFRYSDASTYNRFEQPYAVYRNCVLGCLTNNTNDTRLALSSPSEFYDNVFSLEYCWSKSAYNKYWDIYLNGNPVTDFKTTSYYSIPANLNANGMIPANGSFEPLAGFESHGPQNHKEYPSIPEITEAEIDTETDANGQLHVRINAVARD